ncbi:MAG: SRPBCC family protein [Pseudomonadota bacterium]
MSIRVVVERRILIDAPMEDVWQNTAESFAGIDQWDANVKRSSAFGDPPPGAPVGGRECQLYKGGPTVEELVQWDSDTRVFAYDIAKGLPGFVQQARNTWTHESSGHNSTQLTMRLELVVSGLLGRLMRAPMRSQLGKLLERAQAELKHYVETGTPHPRKRRRTSK